MHVCECVRACALCGEEEKREKMIMQVVKLLFPFAKLLQLIKWLIDLLPRSSPSFSTID